MFTVLLHSSKTMRPQSTESLPYKKPGFLSEAAQLNDELRSCSVKELASLMQLSPKKAEETKQLIDAWSVKKPGSRPAIDAFLGDIYSGLQVQAFSATDRAYANDHLLILSGMYGALKALDSIHPYRLEMGYKLSGQDFKDLYDFWGDKIARIIPETSIILNLSAVEYTKSHLKNIHNPIITPKFLTVSPKTGEPTFVTVHAKVARGAFAHWIIKNKVESIDQLAEFNEIGYEFDSSLSSPAEPVFACKEFKGIGLSVRLT